MIQRMLASAVFAGVAAGLLAAILHFAFIQNYILLGEAYETGAAQHFAGVATSDSAAAPAEGAAAVEAHDHASTEAHDHGAPAGDEASAFKRNTLTVLFTALVYAGYGLLLVAGFSLAEHFGKTVTARDGLFWGIAGFAAFQLMPAMGLAPELPGTIAADVTARQLWWVGTAVSTAGALALIGYGRGALAYGAAAILLAAPHLIGAPHLEVFTGVAPPEVAASFATRALGVGLIAWATLGWLAARFWNDRAT